MVPTPRGKSSRLSDKPFFIGTFKQPRRDDTIDYEVLHHLVSHPLTTIYFRFSGLLDLRVFIKHCFFGYFRNEIVFEVFKTTVTAQTQDTCSIVALLF